MDNRDEVWAGPFWDADGEIDDLLNSIDRLKDVIRRAYAPLKGGPATYPCTGGNCGLREEYEGAESILRKEIESWEEE